MSVLLVSCQIKQHTGQADKTGDKSKPVPGKGRKLYSGRYLQEKDGAPRKMPVAFKEPKPKAEPLSNYGNPDSYLVNGKHYRVMRSTSGYKARGMASWYGTKFNKQRTSSGEPYDMYAMTAAHKTLPLPSYVKVRNLKNGHEAIVKVNDRGPFHEGRIIDLSYAAAVKLGLLPKGTAPVEIETLMGFSKKAYYYLQAGAFSSKDLAQSLQQKLAHLTTSPVFIEPYQDRYLVKVGPFANKEMTDRLKSVLASNGVYGSFALLK